jgi:hypothetical protein
MTIDCIFKLNNNTDDIINKFSLKKILKNTRVSIYENNDMRFSFYDKVVRVLVFKNKQQVVDNLYHYFYGGES